MSTPDLLPCPFCGGKASLRSWAPRGRVRAYYAVCSTCMAMSADYRDEVLLEVAWNRRADSESEEMPDD
ncbi:MAG: restriction alleviation protein, Lar family [Armatimonadetes bacterium]|nr:restriction alleviation protein, Lar family [Armatimonadota bacterium]